jgi:hypothetical protein
VLIPCRLSDVVAKIITILEGRWGVLDNTRVTGRVVTIFKEDRGLIQSVVAIKVVVSDKELYTVAWSQSIELAKRCIYTRRFSLRYTSSSQQLGFIPGSRVRGRLARLPNVNPNLRRLSSGIFDSHDIRDIGNFVCTSGSTGGSLVTFRPIGFAGLICCLHHMLASNKDHK